MCLIVKTVTENRPIATFTNTQGVDSLYRNYDLVNHLSMY